MYFMCDGVFMKRVLSFLVYLVSAGFNAYAVDCFVCDYNYQHYLKGYRGI